ncbi:pilus assembly FimT family protein [Acinetobacter ursingii]|uniref:pilus assembly FimT family protein n=1 Tax=Acinetobacter ursingii TaxID=108980 RepID=UPI0021CDDBBB|nr:prepilin-type N-terminal cleavage/methylation domain-containing protein [Acinetobacter ursingii]MCU4483015.1 prepilin-type N-terminal cleavage/methylation domain-containing protein [Acinetobacter ursingii]MCU4507337.1 prepilin-type N-terminal cleavage/methylation domain-containing protein [Acinetobacter ursingii]MCU4571221.1 prepilin-type N-terminal cleavage/methylation domain-containing protein [Acinetobacter ursingii]
MRRSLGFTLIELMVTIAVLAIIATMAAPSFGDMLATQNLNKSTQDLIFTFNEARSKAVSERRTIIVSLNASQINNSISQLNWTPSGKALLKGGSSTSICFNLLGGVGDLNGATLPQCIPATADKTFEICNKSTGSKSKKVTISKMGTIQQVIEGSCS